MTAYSLGSSTLGGGVVTQGSNNNPIAKALGMITEVIPAEAIATFLAMTSAIAALGPKEASAQLQLNVWLAMGLAIVVTIGFAFIAAAKDIVDTAPNKRFMAVLMVLAQGVGLSLLFIVYVAALPENPIEALWGINSAWGGIVAVAITVVWGLVRAIIAAFKSAR